MSSGGGSCAGTGVSRAICTPSWDTSNTASWHVQNAFVKVVLCATIACGALTHVFISVRYRGGRIQGGGDTGGCRLREMYILDSCRPTRGAKGCLFLFYTICVFLGVVFNSRRSLARLGCVCIRFLQCAVCVGHNVILMLRPFPIFVAAMLTVRFSLGCRPP